MGHLYFTRHGQTVWNVENKICGATDIPLTEYGHRQAIDCGNEILTHHFEIDEILYSPLIRARETARHISNISGIPMREEPRLIEQNFGKYESTPRDGKEFAIAKTHFLDHYGNGESMMEVSQRIYNLLDEITRQDKVYLLVAHNGIARHVHSYFNDMTNEEFAAYGIHNCQIIRYDY